MREVQSRDEQVNKVTLQAFWIKVFSHNLADKILARASPAVQGQSQWFLGIFIVPEASQCLENHFGGEVLSKQLLLQVQLEGCAGQPGTERKHKLKKKHLKLARERHSLATDPSAGSLPTCRARTLRSRVRTVSGSAP